MPRRPHRRRLAARREAVLKAILRREAEGLPLNTYCIEQLEPKLYRLARHSFGSWNAALEAAGINSEAVRQKHRWSRQVILDRLRQLCAQGQPMNCKAVMKVDRKLVTAARVRFGLWRDVLLAAGIDPAEHPGRARRWTRESLVATIKAFAARGTPVNYCTLSLTPLPGAASRLFGSWDAALVAAGFQPAAVRQRVPAWTAKTVLREIRRQSAAGLPLNGRHVKPESLRVRGIAFFGSWDAALAAAGLNPEKIRLRRRRHA